MVSVSMQNARNLILGAFAQTHRHQIFVKVYHFMLHFMSSLVTWDVVINNPQKTCLAT